MNFSMGTLNSRVAKNHRPIKQGSQNSPRSGKKRETISTTLKQDSIKPTLRSITDYWSLRIGISRFGRKKHESYFLFQQVLSEHPALAYSHASSINSKPHPNSSLLFVISLPSKLGFHLVILCFKRVLLRTSFMLSERLVFNLDIQPRV